MADRSVTPPARAGSRGSFSSPAAVRTLPIRTVLVTTAVGCLVLLYLLWWTTYVATHVEQRYTQRPPGEVGRIGGTSVRLLSLTSTVLLADQKYDGPPEAAEPGTVWVVALLEATQEPGAPEFFCTVELLGPDGRTWEPQSNVTRTLPSCSSDLLKPGPPVRFETIFLVPERFVGQIVGVALPDPTVPDRVDVIAPAA